MSHITHQYESYYKPTPNPSQTKKPPSIPPQGGEERGIGLISLMGFIGLISLMGEPFSPSLWD